MLLEVLARGELLLSTIHAVRIQDTFHWEIATTHLFTTAVFIIEKNHGNFTRSFKLTRYYIQYFYSLAYLL